LLPKRERITSRDRIKEILRKKQVHITSPLLNLTAEVNHGSFPRWVVICTKRLGNAVQRNRTRRKFLSVISKISYNIAENMDIIVFPKAYNSKLGADQIRAALEGSLRKLC
jgi:ribonuclease P protein component